MPRFAVRVVAALLVAFVLLPARSGASQGTGAQAGPRPAQDLTARAWTAEDGLPGNLVSAIAQTTDGYLWIGTRGGLARFDGVRFVQVEPDRPGGWAADDILALLGSKDGSLWIGTLNLGLLHLTGDLPEPVPLPSLTGRYTARSLYEAPDGALWVGLDRGLIRLGKGHQPEWFREFDRISVHALAADNEGTLWLGTSEGMYVRRGERFSRAEFGAAWTDVFGLAPGPGELWVATARQGLYRASGGRATPAGSPSGTVWGIHRSRDGAVWVACDEGLKRLRDGRLESIRNRPALSGRVFTVFEDREGTIWVGTLESGLIRLTPARIAVIADDLPYPSVQNVLEDRTGRIWFATAGGGLQQYGGRRIGGTAGLRDLDQSLIGPLLEDRAGRLIFGTGKAGRLYRLEGNRLSTIGLEGTPASLLEDDGGDLWVGTAGRGLSRIRDGRVISRWTTEDGLISPAVLVMAEDGAGGLWLGTPTGLMQFRDGRAAVPGAVSALASRHVTALCRDPAGPLWIGTLRSGLARLEDGRLTRYGRAEGLPTLQVFSVIDDGFGRLWLGTDRGIVSARKQELNDLAAGHRTRVSWTTYGRADGMASAQCSVGSQPSAWRARDGRLWFPTAAGLVIVNPRSQPPVNRVVPPVTIEELRVDGRRFAMSQASDVPAGSKRLEFTYTALSLAAPEKVVFRYRLLGFDREWIEGGARRQVSYTNLEPGRYIFQVIAANNDGVWNETGARWEFSVRPFFYQTAWFAGAVVLFVIGNAWGVYRLALRQLQLKNAVLAERAALSQEIHDHVSQIMTGIVLQLDAARQMLPSGSAAGAPYVERASKLAQQGIEETRVLLRSLRDKGRRAPIEAGLDDALFERVAPLIEGTGVRLRVACNGETSRLRAETRETLFLVGQEAVTNALRHGRPSAIDIQVAIEQAEVRLRVSDDGSGFSTSGSGPGGGLGLDGMARRVASRGGRLDIRSQPGQGTTVVARFPGR